MAKVKIQGHASGTGVLTVTAPNTSTDRTITLPDATATIATTTDVSARLPSITDNGNATAITINSSEKVGIGIADAHHMLHIKENSTSNSLASGVKVQITNEQGAGNFASLRFTGSNQNGFIGYRDGANDQDRRISIGIGADAEHISFSQAGIKFNGDTAEANGLDDYEEGTWTPTITVGTASTAHGVYTRVGRLVQCNGTLTFPSQSSSTVTQLGGLPFTSATYSHGYTGTVRYTDFFAGQLMLTVGSGNTIFDLYDVTYGSSTTQTTYTEMSGKRLDFSITYNAN